jgi:hypothetical protein
MAECSILQVLLALGSFRMIKVKENKGKEGISDDDTKIR